MEEKHKPYFSYDLILTYLFISFFRMKIKRKIQSGGIMNAFGVNPTS